MSDVPFCVEITTLGGVKLPRTVRVFDCRVPEDMLFSYKTEWGTTPLGGERAQIVLGLRGLGLWEATTPISMSGYPDLRDASEETLAEIAHKMVSVTREYRRYYRDALKHPADGQGGSVHYMPIALDLCNYGWGMICDRRLGVTKGFQP